MPQLDILIGKSDIEPYAQVSIFATEEKQLQPYILAAQNLDIKPVLGNSFFTNLVANRNSTIYKALLEGGEYTYQSKTYSFTGLKAAIAAYTYARYVMGKNTQDTAFGFISKESEYSTPATDKALAAKSSIHTMSGQQYLDECIEFLNRNKSTYPLYDSGKVDETKTKGNIRITGVSRF